MQDNDHDPARPSDAETESMTDLSASSMPTEAMPEADAGPGDPKYWGEADPMHHAESDAAVDDIADEDGVKVITISWQALLLPVLAVIMLVGGFWIGRQLGGTNPPPSAAPVAQLSGVPAAGSAAQAEQPIQVQIDPNALQQMQPSADQVIQLPPASHPLVNQLAPDFEMTRLSDGKKVKLSDFKGKPVMVNFWATWCPPCRMEMPWVQAVHEAHKDTGFTVVGVDAGEKVSPDMALDTIKQFVDSMGLTFPVLTGDNTYDVQRAWSVYGLPSTFLIKADGTIVDAHTGMYPNQATLENQLKAILAKE